MFALSMVLRSQLRIS